MQKEYIAEVLMKINPIVRQYNKNVVKLHTGIDSAKANELSLIDSVHFLRHVWGSCLAWGNQSIDYIGRSVQELSHFLTSFATEEEIHDPHAFSEKLDKYSGSKRITPSSENNVTKLTESLQKFSSVRIKTAALIMRILCLDSNFFEIDRDQLIPPLDRVNYRMCRQLFGEKFVLRDFGKEKASYGVKETRNFANLGILVLGKGRILIDNLWFIGHFYHDRRKDVKKTCEMRKGAIVVEYPVLKDLLNRLPESCPFLKYGCKRQ
jgi:hypothetical protein